MALALIVLAIGSVAAGWVGWPHALFGGHNRIEAFLEPAFEAHAMAPANEFTVSEGRPGGQPAETAAAHETPAEGAESTELMLMALSTGIAVAGIGIAAFFWLRKRDAAAPASSGGAIHTLLLNKYYIDELYDAVVVRPIQAMSTTVLWKGADAALIDGSVNGVGSAVSGTSSVLRRLQSGSIRAYAASLFVGVVLILGWYLIR